MKMFIINSIYIVLGNIKFLFSLESILEVWTFSQVCIVLSVLPILWIRQPYLDKVSFQGIGMESYQGEAQIIDLYDFEFVVYYLDEIP